MKMTSALSYSPNSCFTMHHPETGKDMSEFGCRTAESRRQWGEKGERVMKSETSPEAMRNV